MDFKDRVSDEVLRESLRCFSNPGPGMDKISEITTNIYITNMRGAEDIPKLREMAIKLVVFVVDRLGMINFKNYNKRKIETIEIRFSDNNDIYGVLPFEIYEKIQNYTNNSARVLFVCDDGCNKSPAVLSLFYLSRYYDSNYITNIEVTRNLLTTENFIIPAIFKKIKSGRNCAVVNPKIIQHIIMIESNRKKMLYPHWQRVKKDYKKTSSTLPKEEREQNKIRLSERSPKLSKQPVATIPAINIQYDHYDDIFDILE